MDTVDDALGRRGWRIVGEPDAERAALAAGLSSAEDMHRKIYVACTRAHRRTIEVSDVSRHRPTRRIADAALGGTLDRRRARGIPGSSSNTPSNGSGPG